MSEHKIAVEISIALKQNFGDEIEEIFTKYVEDEEVYLFFLYIILHLMIGYLYYIYIYKQV